jgi:hypothetical protein
VNQELQSFGVVNLILGQTANCLPAARRNIILEQTANSQLRLLFRQDFQEESFEWGSLKWETLEQRRGGALSFEKC